MFRGRRNSSRMSESFFAKSVHVATVVAAYWFVSISLVFLNKYLLSSSDVKLDAPLFITWFQCVVAVILCYFLSLAAKFYPSYISFPEFKIDIQIVKQVMPLSVIFVLMIACNNLCLMYVGVAFYYIVRSLTTIFNVILSYAILRQTTSCKAITCCGVIIAGFALGVNMESVGGGLSIWGVVYGVGASLFVALYAIYTKKVLPAVDENIWRLSIYNNLNACFLFLPLMLATGEFSVVYNFVKINDVTFWTFMVVSGLFGFAIGYVTGLQIQVTSPLTHNISGTAKAAAQTVIATVYYQDIKGYLWWFSNLVVLLGSAAYTQVKRSEMKKSFDDQVKNSKEDLTQPLEKANAASIKSNKMSWDEEKEIEMLPREI